MATTLSRYLRLKINSNLTADAKYNLERIDTLGATFITDSTSQLNIRSAADIQIEPNSPDLGGSGLGGSVSIGTVSHEIDSLSVYAAEVNFSKPLGNLDTATGGTKYLRIRYKSDLSGSVDTGADRTLSIDPQGADRSVILGGNLTTASSLSFPTNSAGYLSNDGSGGLTWVPISGGGDVLGAEYSWLSATGTTKVVTHSLGSTAVDVTILDESNEQILVDSIVINSISQITLTSSEAPTVSWRVLLQAKP